MIYRLLFLIFLGTAAVAGEFLDNWPPGKTEKLTYELKTLIPRETISYNHVEIVRSKDNQDIFIISQSLEIPHQSIRMVSIEKYDRRNIRLISSENHLKFPPQMKQRYGADSIVVKARTVGDSLKIVSSVEAIPSTTIPFPDDMITSTGSQLLARSMEFKTGGTLTYSYINLLILFDSQPVPQEVTDSVLDKESVSIALGTYECYKVKNTVPGSVGYSYYTADERRIPIKIVLMDPQGQKPSMTMILQKYE
ncbi:MAG: hypothetical protein JSU69_04520 [Candidatus Zixiibacteriota bacterium]|nr:MAG: hypothetical protein JSU69_04520 [candidate division Zixibacteria bacterium]